MDPLSVLLLSNIVSVTAVGVGNVGLYIPPDISNSWDSEVRSFTTSRDCFLIYGPEKKFCSGQQKMKHTSPITAVFRKNIVSTDLRSEIKKLRN